MPNFIKTFVGAAALTAGFTMGSLAQINDGRLGPDVMTGAALDAALADMNAHLQARYKQDDVFLTLGVAPPADFVATARATAMLPLAPQEVQNTAFGPAVSGDVSLMAHLAALDEDRKRHGEDLFLRLSRDAASGEVPDFGDVARNVYHSDLPDIVRDDPSLDAQMQALKTGLRAFEDRAVRLRRAVPGITDEAFDSYVSALKLFY